MQFTDKEIKTFYGLVKYPDLNDRELSEIISIKLSTVTAIRRRLFENKLYSEVTVPMMESLGAEILVVGYGTFTAQTQKEHDDLARKTAEHCSSIFLLGDAGDHGFFMSLANNYTEIKKDLDSFNHYMSHSGLGTEPWSYALFPFAVSKIINYFDFSPSLCSHFDIREKQPDIKLEYEKPRLADLTPKEKIVLKGLVKYPGISDSTLSEKIDVSRQAISEMRGRFVTDGVIKNLRIPNMSRLGCELMTLTHSQFNPRCQLMDRKEGVKLMARESPHVFAVSGSFENVMLHAHRDYAAMDEIRKKLVAYYKMHDFIRGEPKIQIFLTSKLRYHRWFDFEQILAKSLDAI